MSFIDIFSSESILAFLSKANVMLGLPAIIIFLTVGIILTFKTRFIQIRALPRFFSFVKKGFERESSEGKTISALHAMFTAMGTSLGMGNIVGPSVAIVIGGPGALFWLVLYAFFGGVTRFVEATFAIVTRKKAADGHIVGGPVQYLRLVHKAVANWYGYVMIILFAVWSGLQSNTLANIMAKESVPKWIVGLALAAIVAIVLKGGAQRVGFVASKLVPVMFVLYMIFSLWIIFSNIDALLNALKLIFSHILTPAAPVGAFLGSTLANSMRIGIFKSIYITEAGLGTSSIPHSLSDAKRPTDQGLLAMYSICADAFLSFISGMVVLVTGLWLTTSKLDSTLVYTAFKSYSAPFLGGIVLIICVTMFVLTTVIGNSFNGVQSFASFAGHKWLGFYKAFTVIVIFLGSMVSVPLIWELGDFIMTFVVVPNVISLVLISFRYPGVIDIKKKEPILRLEK